MVWWPSVAALQGEAEPLAHHVLADGRLVAAVSHDLRGEDGQATATAVRMIWTGDHLDAARRLQGTLAGPARTTVLRRALVTRAISGRAAAPNVVS